MNLLLFADHPNDSGPIYRETVLGRFPVEPFNTLSNIFFIAIVIYFSYRVYRNYREQWFLSFALPVLFIGWLGGTIYHATRSHEIWLLMDWVPIVILCLSSSLYFASKASNKKRQVVGLMVLVLFLVIGIKFIPFKTHGENYGYITSAIGVILPIAIHVWQTKFKHAKFMAFAVLSFIVAISFRALDRYIHFSMGTHWLWHSFGAFTVFFLMKYIYLDAKTSNLEP
ncbi:ceramidase domain-containing protein [Zunongwangia sp. HRR-M8]|uniref:ceramidase domain-containing protein n=1 Tax=Zunongwangia sp. HRR-M8 TaxID=3015170 RepID=UPI0022DCFEA8|nr:ceramidase domain-containing protein [Zunongwangia sp. HRR-M8]WBL22182.1 hypothetical protein PBT89_15900 [Zunongwangia sp. HRR-M8]